MKGLKIVALVIGGIVVLLAVVLALALVPSVQTWAVRKAVAGQSGTDIQVSRVAAGFSGADVTDLRYAKDGIVITAKGVSARYSAWDYITSQRINADSVAIDDLVVDLRNAKPAAATVPAGTTPSTSTTPDSSPHPSGTSAPRTADAPEKKEPFQGLLTEARLPFDVRIANLTAKGRALLPDNQIVTFDLKGTGIENGQRGKLEWTIDFADSTAGAALRALRVNGTAALHITNDRRIDSIEVETIAAAMGPKLSAEQIKLSARAEKPAATGDETYAASVSLVKGSALEPIVKTNAKYLSASREIAGAWDVALRSDQFAGLLADLGLPELAANGAGKFSFKPDTNAVAASGELEARTAQLQKISPALAAVGAVQLKTTFDGGMADNVARLDKLNLEVAGADGRKFAQISSLQKIDYQLTEKRVMLADPKAELARISLQALPLAWAQAFVKTMQIESGDLSMVLAVEAEPDGSRVRARSVEPLAIRTVTIREGDKLLADRVTLTTRPSVDYSATKLSAQLAELTITMPAGDALSGSLSAEVANHSTNPAITFAAQLQAKVINALKPYLPVETGPLAITANIEGRHEGNVLQLAKATANVNREGGVLLSALELQQPVRADLNASTFTVPNPAATAARVRLGEIPLAWAESFVAKSKFSGSLKSATFDVAMRSAADVTLTTAEPLVLSAVTAAIDSKPMLQKVDLLANFTATKRGDAVACEVGKLEVKQGQAVLAALSVTGEAKLGAKMTLSAKGNLEADAAALMTQPVLASFATLSRGRVAAAFEANVSDSTQAKAAISAKNLVAKQDNRALGDLELTLTANVKPDGSGTIALPLTLTNASRKSDLSIDGAFGRASNKETFLFTGKITSNQLVADDFQPLAALAPAGEQPKTPTTPTTTRDAAPFWKAVNGKLELDLKRVLYGKDYVVSGVRGMAVITDSKLSLDGLEGKFKENPFKVAAGVTFAAQRPKPYALTGSVKVAGLEIGEILRAANPNEKPALESRVSVLASLNGNGGSVADLMKNVYGQFDVQGTQGVLRALGRKGGQVASAASTILGIVGAVRGSNTTVALAELASAFAEMRFENFTMRVERGADLNLKLSTLEFISPIMHLTGSGGITSANTGAARPIGQPAGLAPTAGAGAAGSIQNQPMKIQLQLGAKDQLAHLLNRAGVLGQNVDARGYNLMTQTFSIGGTPANPDSSQLWQMLGSAAARAAAEAFLK
ncbi:MAG: hypothetical protein ACREF9_05965 [Opitutaceae bacterium]